MTGGAGAELIEIHALEFVREKYLELWQTVQGHDEDS